jgi:hypothetical protein
MISKMLKIIYRKHSKEFYKKMVTKLSNCSMVGKEEILNFVMSMDMIDSDEDL